MRTRVYEAELTAWIENGWPSHGNSPRPRWSREVFRQIFEEELERDARAAAKSLEGQEIRELRARIVELEREVKALRESAEHALNSLRLISQGFAEMPDDIKRTVAKVLEERSVMQDAGVWRADKHYRAGETVSHKGAAWTATLSTKGMIPGHGGEGWRDDRKKRHDRTAAPGPGRSSAPARSQAGGQMTLDEARFALDRMLLERHAEGLPTYIQQIDCEECEDDVSIMAYCYFIGDPDPITILFDRPTLFDHWACSEELLREPEATIH